VRDSKVDLKKKIIQSAPLGTSNFLGGSTKLGEGPMECPRCKGVMVKDRFTDIDDDTGARGFSGWRCLTCGEILDPVISANRQGHHEPLLGRSRKKFATQLG